MNDKLVTKSFSISDLDKIVKKTGKAQSFVNINVTDYDIINAILASVSGTIVGAAATVMGGSAGALAAGFTTPIILGFLENQKIQIQSLLKSIQTQKKNGLMTITYCKFTGYGTGSGGASGYPTYKAYKTVCSIY